MKTEIEIINETIEYYGSDPSRRAASERGFGCFYQHSKNGNRCAVGRCIDVEAHVPGHHGTVGTFGGIFSELAEHFKKASKPIPFLPGYEGHSVEFWVNLQVFHDATTHFDDNGLTEEGLAYVNTLRAVYEGQ